MKIVLAAVVLASAVGVLIWMGIVEGSISVLKLHQLKDHPEGKVCRIEGLIDTIEQLAGPLRFTMRSATERSLKLKVESRASTPDNFKPDHSVSVRGIFDPKENLFRADEVTTACPSKYEEAKAPKAEASPAYLPTTAPAAPPAEKGREV